MKHGDYIGKCYDAPEGFLRVIGYVDRPALLLQNPFTGEQQTVVINCLNHEEMREITDSDALDMACSQMSNREPSK